MKNIITDEEVNKALDTWRLPGSAELCMRNALADFLNNRPQVAQLRPIAEMPETVPEGCERLYWAPHNGWWISAGNDVTHAIDVYTKLPTPDPDAEMRREFESLFEVGGKLHLWSPEKPAWEGKRYKLVLHENVWLGFKLAKTTTA